MTPRRTFLATMASLPFCGWMKPVEAVPLVGVVEGYDPSTRGITIADGCCCCGDMKVEVTILDWPDDGSQVCELTADEIARTIYEPVTPLTPPPR